jgi:hypothetical protein
MQLTGEELVVAAQPLLGSKTGTWTNQRTSHHVQGLNPPEVYKYHRDVDGD